MEAFEEAIAASKEQSLIFKGKRTKRQRPQSPIPFSIISPPIVSSHARNIEEESKKDGTVITSSSSSASWFSNNNATLKAEEEEEEEQDIANCLILLSQGHSVPIPNHEANNNNTYRFSSRRFLETSSSSNGGGKAGYYVYQCKTCDRTFPSFQALGGHRASHKKPKATLSLYSNIDVKKNIYESDAVSLVTTSTIYNNKNNNNRSVAVYGKAGSNKVHECGVCGAEFTSGQALGGHMRRHRGAVVVTAAPAHVVTVATAAANTELSLSSMSFDQFSDGQDHLVTPATKRGKKTVVSLDLDLNLPAPEDENRVNGFTFSLKQKQEQEHQPMKQREEPKCLLMSAPTLVDCHY
ncbi:hypothetical protein N665_0029s0111 [Sinapis alba]|nr:hypothetical protein N665_0029s0111 [Sinapis alba]